VPGRICRPIAGFRDVEARLAQGLETAFERDLKDCHPFATDGYQRCYVLIRLRASTARLLSPLL
jgi:hypothetical protein